jgi:hypothetical protein
MAVRGDDSVGLALIRGEARAAILSVGELNQHPVDVKKQIKIVQNFAEVPSFVVLMNPKSMGVSKTDLIKQLNVFSDAPEGKTFESRTNFKVRTQINEKELSNMDVYLDKTRRLMV